MGGAILKELAIADRALSLETAFKEKDTFAPPLQGATNIIVRLWMRP
jgi:hypothetical protein